MKLILIVSLFLRIVSSWPETLLQIIPINSVESDALKRCASHQEMGVQPLTYQFSETRLSFAVEKSVSKEVVKRIHEELIV